MKSLKIAKQITNRETDSVDKYLKDITKFGLIDATEEIKLAERIKKGDKLALSMLIKSNLRFVISVAKQYQNMGLEFDLQVSEAEQYKGGEILTVDLGFGAENIPDPEGQEAFKSLLGDQLTVPMGFAGNYAVIGVGKNARNHVEGLLDAVEAGERGTLAMSPANLGLSEENNFFLGVSVPKILKWVSVYAPEAPEFDVIDGPGLGISASFTESHVVGELVVPLAEILAIKDVVQKVEAANKMEEPATE